MSVPAAGAPPWHTPMTAGDGPVVATTAEPAAADALPAPPESGTAAPTATDMPATPERARDPAPRPPSSRPPPLRQFELVERVKAYDPNADEAAINRAYVYAVQKHGTQKRASGDPYFSHPVEVAGILSGMRLDGDSIITALLHDTVEDTDATLKEIEQLFGGKIARLVDGVTKLTRLELQSDQTRHAENFRKLVLAMSEDIRVLLVKLADRLHNMRTLHFIKNPDKRRRIAAETMDIYAPLAERMGMQQIKDELEDFAFAEINPDARKSIHRRLAFLREAGGTAVPMIETELDSALAAAGITAEVHGREKSAYSIWRKMERKNIAFEALFDIMAFRVTVPSVEQCYAALGVIHSRYRLIPGRFKDYVSLPKPNRYQSIHTGVIGPGRKRIEVQIRTQDMHTVAELGVAAHWVYKNGGDSDDKAGRQYAWLRDLLEVLDHAAGPEEFLEHTKLAMFQDQVFCFTPKGDLINLPALATAVDFAYAVHSEVGDTCVGAKINGTLRPLRTVLRNGDQVEINTSKNQTPSPEWERFAVTAKARARIRRFIRTRARAEYIALGRQILQRLFREEGYDYADKAVEGVIKQFKIGSTDDLLAQVGEGLHSGRAVLHAIFPGIRDRLKPEQPMTLPASGDTPLARARSRKGGGVPINGLIPGMAIHYAGCCHPLPGDRIVGIVSTGRGVTIHTIDCDTLARFQDEPARWLDVSWNREEAAGDAFIGRVYAELDNAPGVLGELCSVIGKNTGNITNLKITNRSTDFFEILIDIEVQDAKHLNNVIAALRATPSVNAVDRAHG